MHYLVPPVGAVALLTLISSGEFIAFEICKLDPEKEMFVPFKESWPIKVRASTVTGYTDAQLGVPNKPGEVECTRIYTTGGTFFVIGSVKEVCVKLKDKNCQLETQP